MAQLAKNAVLKLTDLAESVGRDEIKKAFLAYPADIAHVEGPSEGVAFVRLRGEDDGKTVRPPFLPLDSVSGRCR